MLDIKGRIITIIGAKRSGIALVQLVLRLGGIPRISEFADKSSLDETTRNWIRDHRIPVEFNGHTEDFVKQGEIIVLSPGVRIDSPPVRWAHQHNIPVLGEIEFAYQFCIKPVIAITGSNGKTTVSTLIHLLIEESGQRSVLCGNVGRPFSQFVPDLSAKDYVVLEVSSFQMESLLDTKSVYRKERGEGYPVFRGFKPYVAVLLNFSQNHLDRHKDLAEYFEAKTRLFINQDKNDFAVLNGSDERLKSFSGTLRSQVRYFNLDDGAETERMNPNQRAVYQVASILGIDPRICQAVFSRFKGVEHRLEFVRTLKGVDYINDSKATTAEAGRWALESLSKPVIMLCGGRDKNIDFTSLKKLVQKKVKRMVVFGEAKEKLQQTFQEVVQVEPCDEINAAVQTAKKFAQQGDCIVLSPMCASFDQFSDYEERGRVFKHIVNGLE